jgi:subtilisin family serine protease
MTGKRIWIFLFLLLFLLPYTKAEAQEIVIKTNKISELQHKYTIKILDQIQNQGIYKVEIPKKLYLQNLKNNKSVKILIKNKKVSYDSTPSASNAVLPLKFNETWGSQAMNFQFPLIGKNKVKIALLDTGVELNNRTLMKHLLKGVNLVNSKQTADDDQGHGTHIAGIISMGLPQSIQIVPIKIMDSHGQGDVFTVAKGIYLAIDKGVDIMNISLGTESDIPLIHDAIQKALDKGITIVAASGNYGGSFIEYPAHYQDVISVGAIDSSGKRAYFSQYGKELDFVAPGVSIQSTYLDNNYMNLDGTSMATAFITRAAAIVKSIQPKLTSTQIFSLFKQAAIPLGKSTFSEETGYGKLDMGKLYFLSALYHEKTKTTATVSKNKIWHIHFKGKVSPSSVNNKTLFIVDDKNNVIESKISINKNGNEMSIAPLKPLSSGKSYLLCLTSFIHSINRAQNLNNAILAFTIK